MLKQRSKPASKVTAILLALMMAVVFMPTFAFAADGDGGGTAAEPITVYLTVSDQGDIPADKNGTVMAWREVKATDADKDGKITYNEALIAAHDTYYEGGATAGYAVGSPNGYEIVTKLWGKDTINTLFFVNGDGIPSGVTVDTVKDGDELVASINKDSVYYSDWYTEFDDYAKETNTNKQITLTLKGHLGMAYTPEEKKNVALKDVEIGEWISKDQPFKPIEENGKTVKTDENGQVTLSFEESGTHIITAKGTVKSKVADYSDYPNVKYIDNDCPTIAPACIVIVWKSDNPLAVKAVAKTVKAKKLKKKAQKVSGAVKITKQGAGTITYKGVGTNAKSKKALKINKNTGKITVKKNTKKGLYKMRVTVTASGDKSYMPGSKTVTVKIRVK